MMSLGSTFTGNMNMKFPHSVTVSLHVHFVLTKILFSPGINCTKADLDDIDNNNPEMTLSDYDGKVYFESVQKFKCKTFGKSFYNETGNSFSATRSVECQSDRSWQPGAITEPCRCE